MGVFGWRNFNNFYPVEKTVKVKKRKEALDSEG